MEDGSEKLNLGNGGQRTEIRDQRAEEGTC
jgi:hypothetical protein